MADFTRDLAPPPRALAVAAHPDDNEFGVAGTAAKWADAGCEFNYLIATDGSKGTWSREQPAAELVVIREREQREAARILGVSRVVFMRKIDGELENSLALRRELATWLRRLRPTVVISHDPWRRYLLHPDHRAIGMAVCDAVVAARDHLFYPELVDSGLDAWRPDRILLYQTDTPTHVEDITVTFERKIEALRAHASQHRSTMGEDFDVFVDKMRARAFEAGNQIGVDAGEGFHEIPTG